MAGLRRFPKWPQAAPRAMAIGVDIQPTRSKLYTDMTALLQIAVSGSMISLCFCGSVMKVMKKYPVVSKYQQT